LKLEKLRGLIKKNKAMKLGGLSPNSLTSICCGLFSLYKQIHIKSK